MRQAPRRGGSRSGRGSSARRRRRRRCYHLDGVEVVPAHKEPDHFAQVIGDHVKRQAEAADAHLAPGVAATAREEPRGQSAEDRNARKTARQRQPSLQSSSKFAELIKFAEQEERRALCPRSSVDQRGSWDAARGDLRQLARQLARGLLDDGAPNSRDRGPGCRRPSPCKAPPWPPQSFASPTAASGCGWR